MENAVLVEIKMVRALDRNHDAHCLNCSFGGDRTYSVLILGSADQKRIGWNVSAFANSAAAKSVRT